MFHTILRLFWKYWASLVNKGPDICASGSSPPVHIHGQIRADNEIGVVTV